MAHIATVAPDTLMRWIGTAQAPVIIDVSLEEDVQADPCLIPTAIRHDHWSVGDLAADLEECVVVTVCQKGRKLSQGTAALLRARGIAARALEGGNYAWRDAGLPRVPQALLPAPDGPQRWVLPAAPTLEHLACAWLIKRFLTPRADILFVPLAEVTDIADKFSATAVRSLGEAPDEPPFRALVTRYGLQTEALQVMAWALSTTEEMAGLTALGTGLCLGHPEDQERLTAAMTLCDALYLWARDGRADEMAA
ncbi:chromate resistance protein ChrB domain-containing protein [Roseobacter sp. A03A-229]